MKPHAAPQRWTPTEKKFMEMAFAEARKVKGQTLPNPAVGAILARRGVVVGKGGTRPAGQAHAEIVALEKAGPDAAGSTLFVTLEPCSHHGRTPPCVDAIIAAGIRKVVVAIEDANPRVGGEGISALRKAGLEVRVGLMEEEAARFYEGFFHLIRNGRPLVMLKIAQSLDGRINGKPGEETAITGEAARKWTHAMRAMADAVIITGRTLRVDDPDLTPRLAQASGSAKGHAPDVVVLSRRGPFPASARVFSPERAPKTYVVGESGEGLPAGVVHVPTGTAADAEQTLAILSAFFLERGYQSVLVEGGPALWDLYLNQGSWDKLFVLTAPLVLPAGRRWDSGLSQDWGESLKFRNLTPFGNDLLTEFGNSESRE